MPKAASFHAKTRQFIPTTNYCKYIVAAFKAVGFRRGREMPPATHLATWCHQQGQVNRKFFKASTLWTDVFYVKMSICLFVCVCVCVYTFKVPFKRLFAPIPEVGCPIFLEIQNPWGKVMERSGLRFKHFSLEVVYNRQTKSCFFG